MAKGWPQKESADYGDKLYLKKDQTVRVQIIEEAPEIYYTHYIAGKTVKCEGPGCPHCAAGEKRNQKGSLKVIDQSDGKEKALCGTAALFQSIKATIDLCGGYHGLVFAISATGDKSERRYPVTNVPIPGGLAKVAKPAVDDDDPFK